MWVAPTAEDDSGGQVSVVASNQPGDSFPIGVTTVTYTFTDPSGNAAVCSFVVMVNSPSMPDTTDPVISNCPANQVVGPDAGSTVATVSWVEPTATDNSGMEPGVARSHTPPATFPVNTITRVSYIFFDNSGNFASCAFTITVSGSGTPTDRTPPVISNCPSDITVTAAPGASSAPASWVEPTAVGNDGQAPSVTRSSAPNTNFNLGPTQVTYIFTDQSGNQAICSFTVTVISQDPGDITDPVFVDCPNNVVSYVNGPSSTAGVEWSVPSATDNSGIAPTVTGSLTPPVNLGVGSTTATYIATDQSGNQATCSFSVSVILDNVAPVIANCPTDRTETLATGTSAVSVFWTEPTATDNSGSVTSTSTNSPGEAFGAGSTTVTYTFTDAANNQAICSFVITVTSENTANPCASNPCPAGQDCYYRPSPPGYLCLTPRNKRDIEGEQDKCLCKNGGACIHIEDSISCLCPSNFTGVLCEHPAFVMDSPKEFIAQGLQPFHDQASDFEKWLMAGLLALLGLIIIVLAITINQLVPRAAARSKSIDKTSLVY